MDKMSFGQYVFTATYLKLFSISPPFYRFVGNIWGTKRRLQQGLPANYLDRVKRFLTLCRKYQLVKDGDRVLEVGTGWVHWDTVIIRLFYNVEATLFDVWDNRQLASFKQYVGQLRGLIGKEVEMDKAQKQRVDQLITLMLNVDSFDELYQALGFRYVVDEKGTLGQLQEGSFDFIYSHNVLEHVDQQIAAELIQDFYRVLKPGGFSAHSIDLTDHLISFAGIHNMSRKYYLRYDDKMWKRYFENKVQYINRIQRPEWLELFEKAGLELVAKEGSSCVIDLTKIAKMYEHLDRQDLECQRLVAIHKKPGVVHNSGNNL